MLKSTVFRRFVLCSGWLIAAAAEAAEPDGAGRIRANPSSAGAGSDSPTVLSGVSAATARPALVTVAASRPQPAETLAVPFDEGCFGGEARRPRRPDDETEEVRVRGLKSWQTFRDCPDCPEMVVLPAGRFTLGTRGLASDEEPPLKVAVTSVAVGKYEVTVGEFLQFAKLTARATGEACRAWAEGNGKWELEGKVDWQEPGYPQTAAHPVVCVSWTDAVDYTSWLSATTGKRYRLLSEAEWEYAARGSRDEDASDQTYWGAEDRQACRFGNFADTTVLGEFSWPDRMNCADNAWFAAPVGQYRPNRFGLYDMLGNVWEWTEDCSTTSYAAGRPDARPYICGQCDRRIIRGAAWASKPANVRIGNRARAPSDRRSVTIGFRVARDLD